MNNSRKIIIYIIIAAFFLTTGVFIKSQNPLVVDGKVRITLQDFNTYYSFTSEAYRRNKIHINYMEILNSMILDKVAELELKKLRLDDRSIDEKIVNEKIYNEFKNKEGDFDEETLQGYLRMTGKTLSEYKKHLRLQILRKMFVSALTNKELNEDLLKLINKTSGIKRIYKEITIEDTSMVKDDEIEIDEDDFNLFYNENKDRFIVYGQKKIEIIKIEESLSLKILEFISNSYYNFEILENKFNLKNKKSFTKKNNKKGIIYDENDKDYFSEINHDKIESAIQGLLEGESGIYEENGQLWIISVKENIPDEVGTLDDVKDEAMKFYKEEKKQLKLNEAAYNLGNKDYKSDIKDRILERLNATQQKEVFYTKSPESKAVFDVDIESNKFNLTPIVEYKKVIESKDKNIFFISNKRKIKIIEVTDCKNIFEENTDQMNQKESIKKAINSSRKKSANNLLKNQTSGIIITPEMQKMHNYFSNYDNNKNNKG